MTATWGDLFERADGCEVSEDDVRAALREHREQATAGDGGPDDAASGRTDGDPRTEDG